MKKFILFIVLLISGTTNSFAQYWDYVIDAKTIAAMAKEWARKNKRLSDWKGDEQTIANNQKEIARKVTFIHMVRDSLFKSLQDVNGIIDGKDEKLINKLCYLIEYNQLKLDSIGKIDSQYNIVVEECKNKLAGRAHELLTVTDMALAGHDETNLINKEQRLNLLDYIILTLREMDSIERDVYNSLVLARRVKKAQATDYSNLMKINIASN